MREDGRLWYSNLGGVQIIPEGSGEAVKYYAQLGADAASKKPLGNTIIDLGIGTSFNISSYIGYKNYSVSDFLVEPVTTDNTELGNTGSNDHYLTIYLNVLFNKSYNADSGILTANQKVNINAVGWCGFGSKSFSHSCAVHAYLKLK